PASLSVRPQPSPSRSHHNKRALAQLPELSPRPRRHRHGLRRLRLPRRLLLAPRRHLARGGGGAAAPPRAPARPRPAVPGPGPPRGLRPRREPPVGRRARRDGRLRRPGPGHHHPSTLSEALKSIRSPVFDRDGMLARFDEVVFVKKFGGLLACLEAASPGSGKAIACLLAEEASTDKIKKVKKALKSIGKKSGAIGKASAAA
uniref:Uncharacterized protein n=1 Tax=Triticum urartu TaxID=4572 RepID=A0A8R7TKI0_TRIUA